MKSTKPVNPFSPIEIRKFIMPVSLAATLVLAGMIIELLYDSSPTNMYLVLYGTIGVAYITISNVFLARFANTKESYGIINSLFVGIGLGYLSIHLPPMLTEIN
ncbi:MAG TPA: hypothetical protein VLA72_03100, partial [Anaerolineales bacterium]|nr:hypothetical protein [Anaerolineales bacterium]